MVPARCSAGLEAAHGFYYASKRSYEREYQQLIVRENNQAAMGKSSDYYICDIEYAGSMKVREKRRIRST